jgi:protein SCO1
MRASTLRSALRRFSGARPNSPARVRRWIPALLGLSLALSAAAAPPGPQRVARINGGWTLDDFKLIDQQGRMFTREDLRGRWTLVLFGDTRCGERCTAPLAALTGMSERISRTQKLKTTQVLFVALAGDTPEQLRQYLAPFDRRFVGVTGGPQTVARLVDDLGVAELLPAALVEPDGAYPGVLSVVDPDGVVWGQFLPPFDVQLLTARYLKTRIGR